MGAPTTSVFPLVEVLQDSEADPQPNGRQPYLGKVKLHGDPPELHNFGADWVFRGKQQGWLSTTGDTPVTLRLELLHGKRATEGDGIWNVTRFDTITLHTTDGDVTYDVTCNPGFYVPGEQGFDQVWEQLDDDLAANDTAKAQGYHDGVQPLLGYDVKLAKTKKSKG